VNLFGELERIGARFINPVAQSKGLHAFKSESATPRLFAQALVEETDVPAIEFHSSLNRLLARLNDGHTQYTFKSMILQSLPLEFTLTAGEDGRMKVAAAPAKVMQEALGLDGNNARILDETVAGELVAINDNKPLHFLQVLAKRQGTYLDPGQRLNSLVLGAPFVSDLEGGLQCMVAINCDLMSAGNTTVQLEFASGHVVLVD
jgi:hypothetical protein